MNQFINMLSDNTNYQDLNYRIISKEDVLNSHILPSNIIKSHSRYLNWILIDGIMYYYKQFNLNDFIGEELCKILCLESTHYELAMIKGGIQTISKDFTDKDYEYYNIKDINTYFDKGKNKKFLIYNLSSFIRILYELGYNENIINKLLDDLMKMSAIDYYSRQTDRYFNNYMFKVKDKDISLAPMYDFGESFSFNLGCYMNLGINYNYNNELLNISWANFFYNDLIKKYPNLRNYLEKMYYVNLEELIIGICDKYNLTINKDLIDIYLHEQELSRTRVKELI